MINRILLFTIAMSFSFIGFSQVAIIKNANTGKAVDGVTISSKKPFAFTNTNSQGQADLTKFKESEEIEFRYIGFKTIVESYENLEKNSFVIFLQPTSVNIDAVVISANRWAQPSYEIACRLILVKPKDVQLLNPQTAADLLGTSGEVFIQKSQQGGGSPMIRGFATNRLLYSIDGVRMNTAIYRAGNLQSLISLDPFAIQNAEVLFGSSSVMYGSDAIGAVMSFQTLTPLFSFGDEPLVKGSAVTRFSSANNERTAHFDVNVGWKKWAMLSSISYHNFGDLKMGSHGPDDYLKTYNVMRLDSIDRNIANPDPRVQSPTAYDQFNIMQKIRFKPAKDWDLQYGFHYSETSDFGRYDKHIETKDNEPKYAVWKYGPQKWMMNNLSATHKGNNIAYDEMKIILAQQSFEESRISRNFKGSKNNIQKTQLEQVGAYSLNADFQKLNNKHHLFYGLEYVTNNVQSKGSGLNITDGSVTREDDRYPQADWSSYAAYLNYQYEISEQFTAQAGGRFSSYDVFCDFERYLDVYPFSFSTVSLKNNSTNWNLGLIYKPTKSWIIGLNGSTGFRAPNVDDIGKITEYESGEVVVPNPGLVAEYSYNGELNIAKVFGDYLKINASTYYTFLDKAMVRDEFQVDGEDSMMYDGKMSRIYAVTNAQSAYVYGIQASAEIKLPAGFSISTNLNYQKGEEDRGANGITPVRYVPPTFGITRLSYKTDKLQMQLYATYCAGFKFEDMSVDEQRKPTLYAKDANGNPYQPAWTTLNFQSMYQLSDNIAVTAGIENLTDLRYRVYRSGISSAGRNFVFSLRANF